jgi:hypothetical protein
MKSQRIIAIVTSLAMLGTSPLLLADPGNGQGKGNAHGQQHDKAGKGKPDKAGNAYHGGPQVDIGGVRITLDRHRDYWAPAAPLAARHPEKPRPRQAVTSGHCQETRRQAAGPAAPLRWL